MANIIQQIYAEGTAIGPSFIPNAIATSISPYAEHNSDVHVRRYRIYET